MKCGYCGKNIKGRSAYCSDYCRKKGEARQGFARKTRIPLAVFLIAAVVLALTGVMLAAVRKQDPGFLCMGAGMMTAGVGLLAFPRASRKAGLLCQVGGGLLFAVGFTFFLLWR